MTPLERTHARFERRFATNVVTLTPDALKITEKGRRPDSNVPWADLNKRISALGDSLQASVGRFKAPPTATRARPRAIPTTPRAATGATRSRQRSDGRPAVLDPSSVPGRAPHRPRIDPATAGARRPVVDHA